MKIKHHLKNYAPGAVMSVLMAGGIYGLEWAANIAWFGIIAFSVIGFLSLMIPEETFKSETAKGMSPGAWMFSAFILVASAAQGWFVVSFLYGASWLLVYGRRVSITKNSDMNSKHRTERP